MDRFPAFKNDCLTVDPRNNRLLASLPAADWKRWQPHLELVDMPAGLSLCHSGESPSHVYFPTTASVSILHTTASGACAEIAVIGKEGMVGVPVIMGGGSTPSRAVVRAAGHGFRLGSARVQAEFHRSEAVTRLLLLYAQALMTHTAQIAICNQHHSVDERLCRCFLSALDRSQSSALNMTHESIASLLGVRREGVTAAAQKLQRAGVIAYGRGHVSVLNRRALEARSCECHAVVKTEYERLLPSRSAFGGLRAVGNCAQHWSAATAPLELQASM